MISDEGVYIPPTIPLISGVTGFIDIIFEIFNPYRRVKITIEVPEVKVYINPETITLGVGESYTFDSWVSGLTTKPLLRWSSNGTLAGESNNSRIYSAPGTTGSGFVKSEFSNTVRNLQITRNISAAIKIENITLISDINEAVIENGESKDFNVTVTGAHNKAIDSIAIEGASDGAIIENANAGSGYMFTFKAPAYTGHYSSDAEIYVRAVSASNKSKFGLFKVKVRRPR